jgi:hypothetical protein
MRIVALACLVALAGCGKPAPEQAPKHASVKPLTPVIRGGWATVFGDARGSLDLLGRLGFRPRPYEEKGGNYVSVATPTPMSDPSAKPANIANFTATGDAKTLNSIAFSLDLVGGDETSAKTQFERWIAQAMSQLGVPGERQVAAAIKNEAPVAGDVAGASYAVTRTPIDGGRRLVVTFSRPKGAAGSTEPRNR